MDRARTWSSARRAAAVLAVLAAVCSTAASMPARSVRPQAGEPSPAAEPSPPCLAVGAFVDAPIASGHPGLAVFLDADEAIGPLTMRRSFERTLPSDFASSSAAGDAAAGVRSFVSWKPPHGDHAGAADGRYDEQITVWARSVPRTGVYATAFHEPENDMTAAEFVAFHRHVYTVVKSANPSIRWGPVYMAYWWDPAATAHWVGDPEAWWPGDGYADFVALDWYGHEPTPMTRSGSFRTWYEVMAPTGLPLVIGEYGQYFAPSGEPPDPAKEAARAQAIREDADWILAHPQFVAWLYWQGGDTAGTWQLRDEASQRAWREVAASGCGAAEARGSTAAEPRPAD